MIITKIFKQHKPLFPGYYYVYGVVQILDGILNIIVAPFGYRSDVSSRFAGWYLKKGLEKAKARRAAARQRLQ